MLTNRTCPSINESTIDQEAFWNGHWDAHKIGWLIAGVTAAVLAAFLMLLLQYIGESDAAQRKVLLAKEKRKIPIPFCCIRFRPSKPYFLHALKWSVLQYALVKERLAGKQPLLKFLSIKGIVMITFYQGFLFSVLQDYNVIKGTAYWTAENVADGLQALCTCCEMVIFSVVFLFAFSHKPYAAARPADAPHTSVFWAVLDSLNYADFFVEGWRGLVFIGRFILGRPGTRASNQGPLNIEDAFQGEPLAKRASDETATSATPMRYVGGQMSDSDNDEGQGAYYVQRQTSPPVASYAPPPRESTDEDGYQRQGVQARYPPQEDADMYERRTAAEEAYAQQQRNYAEGTRR
ncbi:hypothetical protein P7C70_g2541, partial [Phenoliferia sp. Uapishka_3]